MIKRITILTLLLCATCTVNLFGWEKKGHDVVVEIARRHLTPKAEAEIDKILDGASMASYASWLDEVRQSPEYQFTASWHYINVDEGEKYRPTKIKKGGDLYTAVQLSIDKLKRHRKLDDSTKCFYLKSLIHLVGDMHCPLHAGRESDHGGHKHTLLWFGRETNLHELWDKTLIESARPWSYTEWAKNIDFGDESKNFAMYCDSKPRDWMNETIELSQQIYAQTEEGGRYSYDYLNEQYTNLEEQLRKGGYRLASLLNDIFE